MTAGGAGGGHYTMYADGEKPPNGAMSAASQYDKLRARGSAQDNGMNNIVVHNENIVNSREHTGHTRGIHR